MFFSDQLHRKFVLEKTPLRVVSLVPSQTELLFDLGLESKIVGITKFCVHPSNLKTDKTIVGGTKNVNIEKVKALNPDLVLCNKEENTLDIVSQLETVCAVHVSDVKTVEDNLALIADYGKIFATQVKAENLILEINTGLKSLKRELLNMPILPVIYTIWKNPWMASGGDTYISDILKLIKLDNYFQDRNRYPQFQLEDINVSKIDTILLSSEPFPFTNSDQIEIAYNCKGIKSQLVDGEMFSWYGSRLLKAIPYLLKLRQSLNE